MANTTKITYAELAPVFKFERVDDQTLRVFGKATTETVDSDKQVVDIKWAGKALEDWLSSGGNLRVMHNPALYPAGVGISLDVTATGADISGDIVEPTAIRLVEKRALRAFSVGISNAKIVRDAKAPGGRIIGGQIVEVSLVDRPANPDCVFSLAKSVDGGTSAWVGTLEKGEEAAEDTPEAAPDNTETTDEETNGDNEITETDAAKVELPDTGLEKGVTEQAPEQTEGTPSAVPPSDDTQDFVGKKDATAKYHMADGSYPINNCADVSDAAKLAHNSKTYSFDAVKAHVLKAKKALGCPDSALPDTWKVATTKAEEIVPSESAPEEAVLPVAPVVTSVVADPEVHTDDDGGSMASWAMRRLHDITCPAYSTAALKSAYATIEKDGLSAALGAPARGMLFQLLQQEVNEDAGTGTESDDIHDIAKAYDSLNDFLEGEADEDAGLTTADFALAARETLRKGAKIEDTADPTDDVRAKTGRTFYGEPSPLKTVHDVIVKMFPKVCTLDTDKSVTVPALSKVADVDENTETDVITVAMLTKRVAEQTQELETKYAVEKADLVKAHGAELEKLNAKIEELSKAPEFTVTTTGGKAPARALRGTQLNKSLAVEDVQKRAQDAERSERIRFLRTLVATGDARSADAAQEVLVSLGISD